MQSTDLLERRPLGLPNVGPWGTDLFPSFKGTIDRMGRWLPEISAALSAKVRKRPVDDLLDTIAEDLVPERPYRREPRAVKRRPKPFQLMNKPRSEMIEIQHRSRYGKHPKSALS